MADQVGELDLFLAVTKDCGIVLYLNQSQQSISPCFGQSANHGVCRPYALAPASGYHLRRLVLTLWVWLSHRTYQVTCDAINHRMMCCQETELPPPVKKSKTEQLTKSLTTPSPSSSSSTTAVSASAHFTDTCADTSHTPSTPSTITTPASSSSSSQGRVTTSQPPPQPSQSPATKVSSMMSISQPTKVE